MADANAAVPAPPPVPGLAFADDPSALPPLDVEAAEGLVALKKEKESGGRPFFRRAAASAAVEEESAAGGLPCAVRILVASQDGVEAWLREAGPGSSCVCVTKEAFAGPGRAGKASFARGLQLACRLRSDPIYLPILEGTVFELSNVGDPSRKRRLSNLKKGAADEVGCHNFSSSPTTASSGPASSSWAEGLRGIEGKPFVELAVAETGYRRLAAMVSSGGIVREYQELVRRSVRCSNFLDLDFRLVDLHEWLKHRGFASFLEGCDVVVMTRGDGGSSLRWVLLRFDFGEGLVKSTKGECLDELEPIFGGRGADRGIGAQCRRRQHNAACNEESGLDWRTWTIPLADGDCLVSPLAQHVLDVLGSENFRSGNGISPLLAYFGCQESEIPADQVHEQIQTTLMFETNNEVSSNELCALSQLQSSSPELRGQGLRLLLNMLCGSNGTQNPKQMLGSVSRRMHPFGGAMGGPCVGEEIASPSSEDQTKRNADKMVLDKKPSSSGKKDGIGFKESAGDEMKQPNPVRPSQTRRGPQAQNKCRNPKLGEKTCCKTVDRFHKPDPKTNNPDNHHQIFDSASEPKCISQWLKCGFLETLLELLVFECKGRHHANHSPVSDGISNMELALDSCMKVLEENPKDGSRQLGRLLLLSLQEGYEDITRLNLSLRRRLDPKEDKSHDGKVNLSDLRGISVTGYPFNQNLDRTFGKMMRLCQLLSLLILRSPFMGGQLGALGALELVLDLYFCLVKRFPINLRLGALSSAGTGSQALKCTQALPGEVDDQDQLGKVLPCLLPSACIGKVARACLMDHCVTPKKEKTDFSWPLSKEWKAISTRGGMRLDSLPLPGALKKGKTDEFRSPNSSDDVCPSTEMASLSDCSANHTEARDSPADNGANSCTMKQRRPFVPLLSLQNVKGFDSRCKPSMQRDQDSKAGAMLRPPRRSSNQVQTSGTSLDFELFTIVNSVKVELLKIMVLLFSNCSRSLQLARRNLFSKFQDNDGDQLVVQFLPDIIGGFLNTAPESTILETKKTLFHVISIIGNCDISEGRTTPQDSSECSRKEEASSLRSWASAVGSSVSTSSKKSASIWLLKEVGDRLEILVSHLEHLLGASDDFKGTDKGGEKLSITTQALGGCYPLLLDRTISSGHVLSLWVDIGLLIRVLEDFIQLWPLRGSVRCVLSTCGKQIESVFGLLAECSRRSNWSLAEMLTMERLLALFTLCMKDSPTENGPPARQDRSTWSEIDTYFWQVLFTNDSHWNCVKSFTVWVMMKSCQGCLSNLYRGYHKVLWEPLEIYYTMLGEHVNSTSISSEIEACKVDKVLMSRKTIFPFLGASILLMKKRLSSQGESPDQPFRMSRLLFLLDFLMNPVEGLVMNITRSHVPFRKSSTTEALNLWNSSNPPKSKPSPKPAAATFNESLFLDYTQDQCTKCASTSRAMDFNQKLASCLKPESLGLLSDIFALKSSDLHDEHANLCANPRAQNPFLVWKYVNPFLEIIFFFFLKYYNKKGDDGSGGGQKWLPSPLSQSNPTRPCASGRRASHCPTTASSSRTSREEEQFSARCPDDEASADTCMTYGQVLRALAQNQTDEVSQSFHRMRVMHFLVQQIGLEYEASQVATPQQDVHPVPTPPMRDFDAEIPDWNRPSGGERVPSAHDKTQCREEDFGRGAESRTRDSLPRRKSCGDMRCRSIRHNVREVDSRNGFHSARDSTLDDIRKEADFRKFSREDRNYEAADPSDGSFDESDDDDESDATPDIAIGEAELGGYPSDAGQTGEDRRRTDVRYTGRFFDLNEEVDRALAEEDELPRIAPFAKELRASSSSSSSEGPGTGASPRAAAAARPAIPRLNLSKSARKGGPAVSSGGSAMASTTLESNARLSALLELQRELKSEGGDTHSGSEGGGGVAGGSSSCYESKRLQRRLYRHEGLHVVMLEIFVALMLTPQGKLETRYSDRYPMESRKLNAPFFLSYHLNHASNLYLLPCLRKRVKEFKPAAFRILKLTCKALFNPKIYANRVCIARGASSQVFTANSRNVTESEKAPEGLVVLKVVDFPKGPYDPCKFFDVYSEVEILEKFSGEPAVCQILDYGVDTESFILVLKHYKCSLHTWRRDHSRGSGSQISADDHRIGAKFTLDKLPLYLEVYSAVLQAVKVLGTENVVHYDLKCDNILLEPTDTCCSESEFWSPRWPPPADSKQALPFRVCIADFGQSKASAYLGGECTVRNRGTEYVKSPEMLKLLSNQSRTDSDFNLRNTDERVGKAVDVWSLGCLLYELLTGEYLFYDEDWLQFYMRVTLPSEELVTREKAAQLGNYGPVVDLLKFILVRDPLQRPSLDDVSICVEQLQLKLAAQEPTTSTAAAEEGFAAEETLSLSEEDSDTEESSSDDPIGNPVTSSEMAVLPWRPDPIGRRVGCLECLRSAICRCRCEDGE